MTKDFIFVCGTGQSGTTALTKALNRHPEICIGMERFKFLIYRSERAEAEFFPSLFEEDRFFSVNANETNQPFPQMYASLKRKYATARYVGDKIPHIFNKYDIISERFSGAHVFYIVRDIAYVADSWNRRAANPDDLSWSSRHDFHKAVEWWNRGNAQSLEFARRKGNLVVIEFEKFFSGGQRYLEALLLRLNLDHNQAAVDGYRHMVAGWKERPRPERAEKPGQDAFILATADFRTRDLLVAECGIRLP